MVKKKRIWELDFLRGIAILLMVFDHAMYYVTTIPSLFSNYYMNNTFINELVHFANNYFRSSFREGWHIVFVTVFLLLVGISCHFSRSNLKRGTQILGFGILLSIGTIILELIGMNGTYIFNGILTLIGTSVLLCCLIDKLPGSKLWFLVFGTIILMVGLNYNMFTVRGVNDIATFEHFMQVVIGTRAYGADSFGLFYAGIVFIGVFIGKTIYDERRSLLPKLDGAWNKPVCFVGRNTIWVYLASPIVLYVIIFIVCLCLGYRF